MDPLDQLGPGPLEPEPLPEWRLDEIAHKYPGEDYGGPWEDSYADLVCISRRGEM